MCANNCNGHGRCRTLRDIAAGALNKRSTGGFGGNVYFSGVSGAFDYNLWDADQKSACVCDAGYEGPDCSLRSCPRGDDPLTPTSDTRWCGSATCTWEKQAFTLTSAPETTFRISFTDNRNMTNSAFFTVETANQVPGFVSDPSKELAGPTTVAGEIMEALRSMPGGILARVEVRALSNDPTLNTGRTYEVEFVGLYGRQNLLAVETYFGSGALTNYLGQLTQKKAVVETAVGNREDIVCSGRGSCDTSNGLCKCFSGYFGAACEYQNALAL